MPYEKTYDLLDLAIWMQSTREGVSLTDIMQKFNVSRRTAERMRDTILTRFPQTEVIFGENNTKRWYIPLGTLKDFVCFTAEELSTLETAKKALKNKRLSEKAEVLDNIINKIKAHMKPNVFYKINTDAEALLEAEGFILRPGPKIKIDPQIIATIRQAILECHQIKISYFNKNSKKTSLNTLDPYGFLYGDRNHYLVARHSDGFCGDNVHNFILSNIKSVEISESYFEPIKDFDLKKYAELSFGAFHEEPFDVEWLFDKTVADEAEQFIFHPSQTMIKNKDGSLTVKFKAGGKLEMDWHLYTWGNSVKVIQPKNWKKNLFTTIFGAKS